ncbi:MAG: aminoglycoside phosphotransferase family protein [Actinomycetota bacterium]
MVTGAELERAVAAIEPGGRLVEVRELTGGVSATVLALDVESPSGSTRRVVFRQHGGREFKGEASEAAIKEHGLLAALHRLGHAVPAPHHLDASGATTDPYLVVEWIDGSTEVSADDLPDALDQMARFLVGLHRVDAGSVRVPGLTEVEDPTDAIVPFVPPTAAGESIRAVLAGRPPTGNPGRSVLHGDYWPGNVMWRDGRLVAVIDWEDAAIGDPMADLATARVELLCGYGADAMERFTARYLELATEDDTAPVTTDLPLWEAYASASALATMAAWGLAPSEERHRRHLTQGVLDRAADELSAAG